jgi:hypothetical protein
MVAPLSAMLRWSKTEMEGMVYFAPPSDKLEVAPKLEDLEGFVIVLAISVTRSTVHDMIHLHPMGFGACGEAWSVASISMELCMW